MTDAAPPSERALDPWPTIAEAGGIDAWVVAELRARGLWDEGTDTSSLSDRERKKYKARREEERRVRRILRQHAWSEFRRNHLVHVGAGIFYHDTPDVDRFDIADPEARRQDNALPKLPNTGALAEALGLSIPRLRWLVFHREVDSGTHYHRWHVPKRDGGLRLISAPKPQLKAAQHWIARNITEHLPVHGAAHGFVPGRSTVSNATVHAGATVVIKLDLKDFYPSVTQPRVKGLFRKAGYGEQVATVLSMLCTEAPREVVELRGKPSYVALGPRSLPQGAPTSPSITNALCLRLDRRMQGLAHKLGFRYSRYADDLTFSWHETPANSGAEAPVGKLLHRVGAIVTAEGFGVHPNKTRIMRSGRRQKVTGLVVNAVETATIPAARVPRKLRRLLRAALHNRARGKSGPESLDRLQGYAAYVYMTDPSHGRPLLEQVAGLRDASPTPEGGPT
ncbi:reverse transcriptase family protein [Paraliomyxa miuraensis]|uniref:reverse transcriptase family protein n=1 Tax=Paraliomyxa miuraensis TaxID=376150 RepID=UPI0022540DA2|nr:reverse transcriptase family protein [Paraliomyxa miuraensis]MCX4243901.1 reverse transcriptase family protein [Paraliomyxa miuraensis]